MHRRAWVWLLAAAVVIASSASVPPSAADAGQPPGLGQPGDGWANPAEGVESSEIRLGAILPSQGPLAAFAADWTDGARAYLSSVAEAGGLWGRVPKLTVEETYDFCHIAAKRAKKLADESPVLAVLGTDLLGCVASDLRDHGVPVVGDAGLHNDSGDLGNVFPLSPGPFHSLHVAAKFMAQRWTDVPNHVDCNPLDLIPVSAPGDLCWYLTRDRRPKPVTRVALITLAGDRLGPQDAVIADFAAALESVGVELVTAGSVEPESNCGEAMSRVRFTEAEMTVLPPTPEEALACLASAAEGTSVTPLYSYAPPGGWVVPWTLATPDFAARAQSRSPMYGWSFFDDPAASTPGMTAYREDLAVHAPDAASSSVWTIAGYTAARLAIFLTGSCGPHPTRSCLQAGAEAVNGWDTGVGLTLGYRPGDHIPSRRLRSMVIRDGRWVAEPDGTATWWEDDLPEGLHGH